MEETPLGLRQAFRRFRQTVPVGECCRVMQLGWSSLTQPALLAVGIALLDALMLLTLIPLLSLLSGGEPPGMLAGLERGNCFAALVGLLLATGFGKAGLSYLLHRHSGELYQRSSSRLSNHLFARYLQFGKGYFQANSQGELWALLDCRHDLLNLFLGLQRVVVNSALLLAHLLVLLVISWPLTLVMLLLLPVLHLILRWRSGRAAAANRALTQQVAELYPEAYSVFSVMDLYRSYNKEEEALQRFRDSNERIRMASVRAWKLEGSLERTREMLSLLALAGLLVITSFLVAQKPTQVLLYLVFFFVVKNSLPLVGTFQQVALLFAERLPGAQKFGQTFQDNGKHLVPQGDQIFAPLRRGIEFRRLNFAYPGGPEVLHHLSLCLEAGKTTALVGPSGAGKSTLVELLLRHYDVPPGTVWLDDRDIRDFQHHSLRGAIAVVGQEALLFRGSLRENLLFGCETAPCQQGLRDILEQVRLDEWVDQLPEGLETRVGDRGLTLSAGQRQRISLARALLRKASIWLMDEATSALDSLTERQIYDSVREFLRQRTVLVIAHRLETLRKADKIVVLAEGRVVQQGTFETLQSESGTFRALLDAQRSQ